MPEFTIAVASDLHCAPGIKSGDSYLTTEMPLRPILNHPVRSLVNQLIRAKGLRADVLVVPGDLTNKADLQGLRTGWQHARSISRALRARQIIATLGNHDVYKGDDPPADPLSVAQDTHDEFPVRGETEKARYWLDCFCMKRVGDAALVALNTVPFSNAVLAKGRGCVGEVCLDKMQNQLVKLGTAAFRVAICHHHPVAQEDVGGSPQDLMENAGRLLDLLAAHKFDLVIHGHKHYPRLIPAPTGGMLPMFVLAAGTLSGALDERLRTRTRNTFHILRLHRESADKACRGLVTTYQWNLGAGWQEASKDSVDLPHETGFGSETSPKQLADDIAASFESSGLSNVPWSEIVATFPDVQYLHHGQFELLERVLLAHQMEIDWPNPPVRPRRISRITSGGV